MEWVLENRVHITALTLSHLGLSVPAIVLAFVLSVPVALAANRVRPVREAVVAGTGLLYAVPSLPLFIILPVLLGTGVRDRINVIVALVLFGMALMVRSAADAFDSVPAEARLSATAQGYSRWGRFWAVDLPLAGGALLAGLRVVSVSTISLVTVSAVLGVESLGSLFTDGFQRGIIPSIVAGVLLSALLALVIDLLLMALGRAAMPWTREARLA